MTSEQEAGLHIPLSTRAEEALDIPEGVMGSRLG